jgi:hypothetical protein
VLRVDSRKLFERIFKCDQIHFAAAWHPQRFIKCQHRLAPASLGSIARSRMAHQNVTDYLRRNSKEMIPVLPLNPLLIDQLQVGFVNQGCTLQRMIRPFPAKLARS